MGDLGDQQAPLRVLGIAMPLAQICRLDAPETHRRLIGTDLYGQVFAALLGQRRLLLHPVADDRIGRPENDAGLGFAYAPRNHIVPGLARWDGVVPPHREAFRLHALDQVPDEVRVLVRIGDEDIGHGWVSAHRGTAATPALRY